MFRRLFLPAGLAWLATFGWAQDQPVGPGRTPQESMPIYSRIRGLFDIELPRLDPPGTVKLILYPHIGDLIRRDYIRTDLGFRWALNDHFELSTAASTYLPHGFSPDSTGYGLGEMNYGLKYIVHDWLQPGNDASISLAIKQPTGQPPADLTDGHNHYTPSFVVQHRSGQYPHLSTFAGTTLDLVTASGAAGNFQLNQPHEHSLSVLAGGVYDMGQLKWTLSGTYATTALIGKNPEHFFYLQPGLVWYVPKKMAFPTKTQWVISLSAPMSWGPDGYQFSLTSRLRAEITFRQVMATMRGASLR
ncbi:MAG: hypothetical protein WCR49_01615 [Opitutae bacterium]